MVMRIEEEAIYLITCKTQYAMKKTMIISVGIAALMLCLCVTFKLHHFVGANILLLSSLATILLITLPVSIIYVARSKPANCILYLFGLFSGLLFFTGLAFKTLHYPASLEISSVAAVFFSVFIVLYARHLYKLEALIIEG